MKSVSRVISSVPSLAARNWAFAILLGAGISLRLLAWLAYKPAILILADSYYYLHAATGTRLGASRPFAYSILFLKPLLAIDGLALVTAVQHGLGLAIGVGLYVLLRRTQVSPLLAAVGTSLVLLDAYQVSLEQQILTETVFEALVVCGLLALLWFQKAPLWACLVGGLLLGTASVTRFVGLALLPVGFIYLLARRAGVLRVGALLVGCLVPLSLYAPWFQGSQGGHSLKDEVTARLYGKVATFADCSSVQPPGVERQLCVRKPPAERKRYYSVWGKSPLDRIRSRADEGDIVGSFIVRFIAHQPADFAAAVAKEFLSFFSWLSTRDLPSRDVRRWQFFYAPHRVFSPTGRVGTAPIFRTTNGSPPGSLGLHERFRLNRGIARELAAYQRTIYTRGALLAALALLGLGGAIFGHDLPGRRMRSACFLLTCGALALYLLPAVFTTFHFRYVIVGLPLLGPAGALGVSLLAARLRPPGAVPA